MALLKPYTKDQDPTIIFNLFSDIKTVASVAIMRMLYRYGFKTAANNPNDDNDIEDIFNIINTCIARGLNIAYPADENTGERTKSQKECIEQLTSLIIPFNTQYRAVLKAMAKIYLEINPVTILKCIHINYFGIVDYKKTAENLVLKREIPMLGKYRISRIFCLNDEIIVFLWNHLNEDDKNTLLRWPVFGLGSPLTRLYQHHESTKLCGRENDLMFAVLDVNEAAVRNFMSQGQELCCARLQIYLRKENWTPTFPFNCRIGVATYLLSRSPLPVSLKIENVLKHRQHFLHMLFEWPYLDMFKQSLDGWQTFRNDFAFRMSLTNICAGRLNKVHVRDPYFDYFKSLWELVLADENLEPGYWIFYATKMVKEAFNDTSVSDSNCLRFVTFLVNKTQQWNKTGLIIYAIDNIEKLYERELIKRMVKLMKHCGLTVDEKKEFFLEAKRSVALKPVFYRLENEDGKYAVVRNFWRSLNSKVLRVRRLQKPSGEYYFEWI